MTSFLILPASDPRSLGMHSVTDIGRRPNGRHIRKGDYISYERLMVSESVCFLRGAGDVRLYGVERAKHAFVENRAVEKKYGLDRVLMTRLPGDSIDLLGLQDLIRLCLRECLWCVIIAGGRGVYFGYDLNVYFCGGEVGADFSSQICNLGMEVRRVSRYPAGFLNILREI